MSTQLKLLNWEPTVFFARGEGGTLCHLVRLEIENRASAVEGALSLQSGAIDERLDLGTIATGSAWYEVFLPDIRQAVPVRVVLWIGTTPQDEREFIWEPVRHWEVHLAHGSHHDIGYTDLPGNVVREHIGFLDYVLDSCERTSDWSDECRFRYVVEQAWSILAWMERRPPKERERMLRLLREGRVEVTALLDNSTSELLSHEEQVRLVYPAFNLRRRYGVPVRSAELNDIPGVSWGLVKVLAGCGVRYFAPAIQDYLAWGIKVRPIWDEEAVLARDMPGAFWWEGQDGSKVLFWYGGQRIEQLELWTYEQATESLPVYLEDLARRGYGHDLIRLKVHGARRDNSPPDIRFSLIAREWNERWAYPRLVVSTNARFFALFEETYGSGLCVLRGDLPNTDYPIGATCRAKELGINRLNHSVLSSAERLSTCAAVRGGFDYPADALAEAWECMLLYDGHTGGMQHPIGPAQEASWCQKAEYAYRAAALAHDLLVKAANHIADGVRLLEEGYHLVVFNPLESRRTDLVRVQAYPPHPCRTILNWRGPEAGSRTRVLGAGLVFGRRRVDLPVDLLEGPFELIDETTGEQIPYQVVTLRDPLAALPFAEQRWSLGQTDEHSIAALNFGRAHLVELVLTATGVPPLGFRTYRLQPTERRPSFEDPFRFNTHSIENQFYRLELDPESGAVASLFDKELGHELVDGQAPHAFNQVIVRLLPSGEIKASSGLTIEPGERGATMASLVVRGAAPGCPLLTQEITLYADIKRVDFATRLLRDPTPLREVYLAFPFDLHKPQFRYDATNAVVEPIRDQLPGSSTDAYAVQRWVAAWDRQACIAWTSLEAPVVELGGLWPCPVSQAHHGVTPPGYGHEFLRDPGQLTVGHLYSFLMNNNYRTNFQVSQVADLLFRYSVTSGSGDWRDLRANAFGLVVSTPLEAVCIRGPQEGSLAFADSFLSLDKPNVVLMTLKAAEDEDGLIVRLNETEGRETVVTVTLPRVEILQAFGVDLVENDLAVLLYDTHSFTVTLAAHGIATVRCRTGRRMPTVRSLTRL